MIWKIFLAVWAVCGLYGTLANIERVPRVWGKRSSGDFIQHLASLLLGPLGILLVMDTGGRWDFWRKYES